MRSTGDVGYFSLISLLPVGNLEIKLARLRSKSMIATRTISSGFNFLDRFRRRLRPHFRDPAQLQDASRRSVASLALQETLQASQSPIIRRPRASQFQSLFATTTTAIPA